LGSGLYFVLCCVGCRMFSIIVVSGPPDLEGRASQDHVEATPLNSPGHAIHRSEAGTSLLAEGDPEERRAGRLDRTVKVMILATRGEWKLNSKAESLDPSSGLVVQVSLVLDAFSINLNVSVSALSI
jgi:hypothetical protein